MIRNDVFRERESYMSLLERERERERQTERVRQTERERERETRRYISNRLSTKIYKCSSICFSLFDRFFPNKIYLLSISSDTNHLDYTRT